MSDRFPVVKLTAEELGLADQAAAEWDRNALRDGRFNSYDGPPHGTAARGILLKIGIPCELAVAKFFNLEWSGIEINRIDVGYCIEVRGIIDHRHKLIVHPNDFSFLPNVLVLSRRPYFELRGWAWNSSAQLPRYWGDPQRSNRWAYWYPQSKLRPMSELGRLLPDLLAESVAMGWRHLRHKPDRSDNSQRKDTMLPVPDYRKGNIK